jgi:hypothetical protein
MALIAADGQQTGYEKRRGARRFGLFSRKIAETTSASHNFDRPTFWPAG